MQPDHKHQIGAHHTSELARLTTGMLVGILALMTFLLSVGLQHPKPLMEFFIYSAFICLGLSLLVYEACTMLGAKAMRLSAQTAPKAGDDAKKLKSGQANTAKWHDIMRVVQRVLFILSVITVVGFGMSAIQLFFPAAQATQSAPATSSGAATGQ